MKETAEILPMLPLRDVVPFPRLSSLPLHIGRERSLSLLENVLVEGKRIFAVCQKDPEIESPTADQIYDTGVIAEIEDVSIDEEHGSRRVKIRGLTRATLMRFVKVEPFYEVEVRPLDDIDYADPDERLQKLVKDLKSAFAEYAEKNQQISRRAEAISSTITSANVLSYFIASHTALPAEVKQQLLSSSDPIDRIRFLLEKIENANAILDAQKQIRRHVKTQMEKSQKEYYLQEQLKAIYKELGYPEQGRKNKGITPIFKSNISEIDKNLCFVLMPFSEAWSDRLYYKLIRPAIESFGLQCIRADNLTGQIIIEDIWTKINQCAFIVADVTTRNPNVMYELGIVHTIGKPSILLTQSVKEIPFDFAHLRHYKYEDNIDGFRELEGTLRKTVMQIYADAYGIELKRSNAAVTEARTELGPGETHE